MKTSRILLTASAAGICLATLGSSLPALASPPLSAPSSTSGTRAALPAVRAALIELDAGRAIITVAGTVSIHDRLHVIRDGKEIASSFVIDDLSSPNPRGRIEIPVIDGVKNVLTLIQGDGDRASSPVEFTLDADTASVDAPIVRRVLQASAGDRFVIDVDGKPGARLEVKNSRGQIAGTASAKDGTSFVAVTLRSPEGPISDRFTLVQSYGTAYSKAVVFSKTDITLPPKGDLLPPTIDSVVREGAFAVITARGSDGAILRIRDLGNRVVAQAPFRDGRTEIWLRVGASEASYRASIASYSAGAAGTTEHESDGAPIVVNDGVGALVPAAPTLGPVSTTASRAVIPVIGEPGSLASIRDRAGAVIAMKAIGASGTTQLSVPLSPRTTTSYSVVQTRSAVDSDPTMFTVGG